jgi:ABC-type dipeptide/oligopeptide/nickel transport system permease subunit
MAESAPSRRRLNAKGVGGGGIVLTLAAVAAFAPLLAPHDPLDQDLLSALLPPRWIEGGDASFPLGTDGLGRDVLSRLIFGARVTIVVAVVAASAACLLGSLLGLAAGYLKGATDQAVSRLVDVWMAFPPVLLSIVLAAMLGAGLTAVVIAIAVIDWTRFARVIRAETLLQSEMDYVAAARMLGMHQGAILLREVLPNLLPLILTLLSIEMGIAVVVEAILSFVGVSVTTDFPTWGGMIAEGRQVIHQAWWVLLLPTLCLIVVVLGFNLLGDGLRQVIDPVHR